MNELGGRGGDLASRAVGGVDVDGFLRWRSVGDFLRASVLIRFNERGVVESATRSRREVVADRRVFDPTAASEFLREVQ